MRRVLLVSTTFYPHRVVGAVRLSQWCRHLPEFGWQPVVACRPYTAPPAPEQLSKALHPEVELHHIGSQAEHPNAATGGLGAQDAESQAPNKTSKGQAVAALTKAVLRKAARSSFLAQRAHEWTVPDAAAFFWLRAQAELQSLVKRKQPDLLLTSGPPHSVHQAGLRLKQAFPYLPWVADFRDPYLLDRRYGAFRAPCVLRPAHVHVERAIYQQADLVTHAIPAQQRWAKRRHPSRARRFRQLYNGVPHELASGSLSPRRALDRAPLVCSMGNGANNERAVLLEAFQGLRAKQSSAGLFHLGAEEAVDARYPPNAAVQVSGHLPHTQALEHLLGADVLVSVSSRLRAKNGALSSKLFEFLACGKPCIVVNPCRLDRTMFGKLKGIKLVSEPTPNEMYGALSWALNPASLPPPTQTEHIRKVYNRRNQTRQLAGWFDELVQ